MSSLHFHYTLEIWQRAKALNLQYWYIPQAHLKQKKSPDPLYSVLIQLTSIISAFTYDLSTNNNTSTSTLLISSCPLSLVTMPQEAIYHNTCSNTSSGLALSYILSHRSIRCSFDDVSGSLISWYNKALINSSNWNFWVLFAYQNQIQS